MIVKVTGIDEAIATLEKAENIQEPLQQACVELVQRGAEVAESAYASQDENTDYFIDVEEMPNGAVLTASGGDIGFLEFGAGILVATDDPFAGEFGDVHPGSWSASKGTGEFAKYGSWHHKGQWYAYVAPTRGMQRALNEIYLNANSVVNRKISEWIGN